MRLTRSRRQLGYNSEDVNVTVADRAACMHCMGLESCSPAWQATVENVSAKREVDSKLSIGISLHRKTYL